jgi:hypothetical protein
VRIHLANAFLTGGVTVELSSASETCVIDPLTTDASEFSQMVMNAEVGTSFSIRVTGSGRIASTKTCVVLGDAFTNLPPGAENGQVFATVTAMTTFFTVTCDTGWQ